MSTHTPDPTGPYAEAPQQGSHEQPAAGQQYGQPAPAYGQPAPPYGQPAGAPWEAPGVQRNTGRPFTITGAICGALALFVVPIVLGPLGIIFGFVGYSKKDRPGLWVGIGSIVTMIIGLVLGAIVFSSMRR